LQKNWGIQLITSSLRYPKSNGFAERMVGIAKNIIKKCTLTNQDIHLSLLEYRNIPIAGSHVSPAQVLMNRQLRSKLPVFETVLQPKIQKGVREGLMRNQEKQALYYNRSVHERPDFKNNDPVLIRDGGNWIKGRVVARHP